MKIKLKRIYLLNQTKLLMLKLEDFTLKLVIEALFGLLVLTSVRAQDLIK